VRVRVGFEPATEYPVGPVASTLTTRPPRAAYHYSTKIIIIDLIIPIRISGTDTEIT
jgi:hypothetical protein